MTRLSRRGFVQGGLLAGAAVSLGPAFWRDALAAVPAAKPGPGPYGPLQPPDKLGIMLPEGFTSRVIARSANQVEGTNYMFPIFPDGAATFPTPDGGWILAINTEVPAVGGASGIRFDKDGTVTSAYRILDNTDVNCAGGPTPWGTWLSCEEVDDGLVWECDPTGSKAAVAHPAMGAFKHEAACVDPDGQAVYLSEDVNGGGLYRFTPTEYPDLSAGRLEIACRGAGDKVVWKEVPDPSGGTGPTRSQVPDMIPFARGEGIWFHAGTVYLATTSDETIHAYEVGTQALSVVYNADEAGPEAPLRGVDNVHVSRSGDLYVAEDSYTNDPDAMDVCIITPDRVVSRFLKLTGPEHKLPDALESETVSIAFSPDGKRLYVGSQRAFGVGILYEISGPFRDVATPTPGAPAPLPDPAPGQPLGLEVARKAGLGRFVKRGLPVSFTLDAEAVVTVTVRAGGKRLARVRRVVEAGPETIRVRPGKKLRASLRRRRRGIKATVVVRIAEPGAEPVVLRRKVRLRRRRG